MMRYSALLASVFVMAGTVATATTMDITYDMTLRLDGMIIDEAENRDYDGPQVGDILTDRLTVSLDASRDEGVVLTDPDDSVNAISWSDFDISDGSGIFEETSGAMFNAYVFNDDGTGTVTSSTADFYVDTWFFGIESYQVSGLGPTPGATSLAPVPLPAALPLLGLGLGAIALAARRRKTT